MISPAFLLCHLILTRKMQLRTGNFSELHYITNAAILSSIRV